MPRKKSRSSIQYLQYLLFRAFLSLFGLIPARTALLFPPLLGFILFHLLKKRRKTGRENLANALGKELGIGERERILREAFTNLGRILVELVHYPRILPPAHWRQSVAFEGEEILEKLKACGKGVVFVTCHFGNWEILGSIGSRLGFSLHAIARPLDNPYLNDYLLKYRERMGMRVISKKGALSEAAKVLKDRKHLAFLIDQDARGRGIFVDFFGLKTSTHPGFALLALKEGVPVVPAFLVREKGFFRFRFVVGRPIYPNQESPRETEMVRITQEATIQGEEMIRKKPEQWLWIHNRWKTPSRRGVGGQRLSTKEVAVSNGS